MSTVPASKFRSIADDILEKIIGYQSRAEHLNYNLRNPAAQAVWEELVKQRLRLTLNQWIYLSNEFPKLTLLRDGLWGNPGRERFSLLPVGDELERQQGARLLAEMLIEVQDALDTHTGDLTNLPFFAYELNPDEVYTTDELPDQTVAEFLSRHPHTSSDLLAQASEELRQWFLHLACHPNFPVEAVPREQISQIFISLGSYGRDGEGQPRRIFTQLWEDGAYDEDLLTRQGPNSARQVAISSLAFYGNNETVSEVLEMDFLNRVETAGLMKGLLRRPDNVDAELLRQALERHLSYLWKQDRSLDHLRMFEMWGAFIGGKDQPTLQEVDLLLQLGRNHLTGTEVRSLAGALGEAGILDGQTLKQQEEQLVHLLKNYPTKVKKMPKLTLSENL